MILPVSGKTFFRASVSEYCFTTVDVKKIGERSNMAFVKIVVFIIKKCLHREELVEASVWVYHCNKAIRLNWLAMSFISYFSYNAIVLSFNLAISTAYHMTAYYCLFKPESHILCYFPRALWTVWLIFNFCLIFSFFSLSINLFFLYSSHSCSIFWSGFLFHCAHKTQSLGQDRAERSTVR